MLIGARVWLRTGVQEVKCPRIPDPLRIPGVCILSGDG